MCCPILNKNIEGKRESDISRLDPIIPLLLIKRQSERVI